MIYLKTSYTSAAIIASEMGVKVSIGSRICTFQNDHISQVQLSQNIRASLKLTKLFTLCDCCSLHLNEGNCVWLPYSAHAKTTLHIRKWCSTNTVHMCNTFMNLTTYYVQLSLISAAIKQLILPCFVQHEGCSYLKIVACRSGWACSSSNSCIWLLHTHTFSQYTLY